MVEGTGHSAKVSLAFLLSFFFFILPFFPLSRVEHTCELMKALSRAPFFFFYKSCFSGK